jgi:hypothetical protein
MSESLNKLANIVAAGWERLFFSGGSAFNLAITRIVVCLTSIWLILSRDLPATSGFPNVFWTHVSVPSQWRYLLFPGHETLERGLQALAILALLILSVGFWTRLTAAVGAMLLYHLAPLETIYWNSNPYLRGFTIPVLALVVLAVSPCGDALSLRSSSGKKLKTAAWEYSWALRLVQIEICFIYFFSGYSKLLDVGLAWLEPATLRAWLLALNQNQETRVFTSLGPWLAEHPWLCFMMGAGSLLLELTFPLALFNTTIRRILLTSAFVMHLGILFAFNITILFLPLFAAFVDWDGIAQRWSKFRLVTRKVI